LFLLSSPTSLTIPQPLSPFNLGTTFQSLPSFNFNSFHFLVETKETRFIHGPKTPAPVTDWEGSLHLVFNHCRDASLIIHPHFRGVRPRRDACLGPSSLAASPIFLGEGQVPQPLLSVSLPLLHLSGGQETPNPFSFTLSGKSRFSGGRASTPTSYLCAPFPYFHAPTSYLCTPIPYFHAPTSYLCAPIPYFHAPTSYLCTPTPYFCALTPFPLFWRVRTPKPLPSLSLLSLFSRLASFTMNNLPPSIPPSSPLACVHKNLKPLQLTPDLKPKPLIFFCNTAWPQYKLGNGSKWPENGTFYFSTLQDLNNFC
uniref:Uncharacterized protein n=1 Tax=Pongo abelii TaxID=9601 RepID=A0A8I5TDS1_PONAB